MKRIHLRGDRTLALKTRFWLRVRFVLRDLWVGIHWKFHRVDCLVCQFVNMEECDALWPKGEGEQGAKFEGRHNNRPGWERLTVWICIVPCFPIILKFIRVRP